MKVPYLSVGLVLAVGASAAPQTMRFGDGVHRLTAADSGTRIVGTSEFSAFGVPISARGFVVKANAALPFKDGDLVLGDMLPDAKASVEVVRQQAVLQVEVR